MFEWRGKCHDTHKVKKKMEAEGSLLASAVGISFTVCCQFPRAAIRPAARVIIRNPWMIWNNQNREKSLSSMSLRTGNDRRVSTVSGSKK
jgi:hypothetical protein